MRNNKPQSSGFFSILTVIICSLTAFLPLTGCFSPWQGDNKGAFSISIGGGESARAISRSVDDETISRLEHSIKLSGGPGPDQSERFTGTKTVHFSVISGRWHISIEAHLDGELFALGSANVDIKPGPNGAVTVPMEIVKQPVETFTVTFVSNGGSDVESQTITIGGLADQPEPPIREGFGFVDWYTDEAFTNLYDFDAPVTANITLYAKWSEIFYTVSFHINDGVSSTFFHTETVGEGGKASAPHSDPIRSGYTFEGWYREANGINEWDFHHDTVTGNITLYAKWNINRYTVTFVSNGGSSVERQTIAHGGLADQVEPPVRYGFGFVDWYTNAGLTNLYDFDTPVTANITLYAMWSEILHTVFFYRNDGVTSIHFHTETVGEGGKASAPHPEPTRAGYALAGWYTEPNCINEWDFHHDTVTKDINLYAKWNESHYFSITFNQIAEQAPNIDGPVIHRSSVNGPTTAVVEVKEPEQYSHIEWHINGTSISRSGPSLTLNSANIAYNSAGKYLITLEVITKSGVPYSRTVIFTVLE